MEIVYEATLYNNAIRRESTQLNDQKKEIYL